MKRFAGLTLIIGCFLMASVFGGGSHSPRWSFPNRVQAQDDDVDLTANALEVTQAIQDLNNSVRLVENKRTFVRFHVSSSGPATRSTAVLRVVGNNRGITLIPLNPNGEITVLANPNRAAITQAFLFELPDGFRTGTIAMRAEVNPPDSNGVRGVTETNVENNALLLSNVVFERVPPVSLVIYNLGYRQDGVEYFAPDTHPFQMINWILRAWPVSGVQYIVRRDRFPGDEIPTCQGVNEFLASKRAWDLQNQINGVRENTRYYAMVSDRGGFMRGCAAGLPGFTSSGPTGVPGNDNGFFGNWNTDVSWGGWYGGHEVAHTFGRFHAEFCNAQAGKPFPNPLGRISPTLTGNEAVYGFDIGLLNVYDPDWRDNMTYCARQWVSPFTYHGLMDAIQNNLLPERMAARLSPQAQTPQDRLLVVGTIFPKTGNIELEPFFVIPNARDVEGRREGNYAIVLRDQDDQVLARYRFTPDLQNTESGQNPDMEAADENQLSISELVPYIVGTTKVDIEGPGGQVLTTVKAGAATPTVTITSPNGGETLSGDSVTVNWTAGDPDGDALTFDVQYSPDNGQTWEMIEQDLKGNSVTIDTTDLIGGSKALFRVWVSDGIHTASDTIDASLTVPNHLPTVKIVTPNAPITMMAGQTLTLVGLAYDADMGNLPQERLQWSSDLDGVLGTGDTISVATLRAGVHTITFNADDGSGTMVTAKIQVTVTGAASSDTIPPVVKILAPNGNDKVKEGKPYEIKWQSSDNVGVVSHSIALSEDDGATFPTAIATGLAGSAQSFVWSVPTTLPPSKKAKIRVSAKDAAGNEGHDDSDADFKIK